MCDCGKRQQYEYNMVEVDGVRRDQRYSTYSEYLNAMGSQGWELCALDFGCLIFKRVKANADES